MKKLILILFLLISLQGYSQSLTTNGMMIGNNGGITTGLFMGGTNSFLNVPTGSTYNQRAKEFFARVTTAGQTLTDAQKTNYNTLFQQLIDSGLIHATLRAGDSLACLWAFPLCLAGTETTALLNLLDTGYNCTNVNSVVFTDSGCKGANTKYLNTNFNMVTDSTIYKMSSGSIGGYIKQRQEASEMLMGTGYATNEGCILYNGGGNLFGNINGGWANITGIDSGFISIIRRVSTTFIIYNGGVFTSKNTNITTKSNYPLYILCYNENGTAKYFCTKIVSFAFIGSGLSETKSRALLNILNNTLKGYGYNVY